MSAPAFPAGLDEALDLAEGLRDRGHEVACREAGGVYFARCPRCDAALWYRAIGGSYHYTLSGLAACPGSPI